MVTAEKVAVTEAIQPEENLVPVTESNATSIAIWTVVTISVVVVAIILLFVVDWGGEEK